MPELPEVETVCRGLAQFVVGKTISSVKINRHDLRLEIPPNLGQVMTGRTVESVKRRAKYIVLELNSQSAIIIHLGMSGSIVFLDQSKPIRTEKEAKHDHVVWHVVWQINSPDSGRDFQIIYNDPRRFGLIQIAENYPWQNHSLLAGLGVEPLEDSFTSVKLAEIMKDRKTAIKQLLLDQRFVVGIGNIYAAEALFQAGISPLRPADSLQKSEIKNLHRAIQSVLTAAIAAGGSSLKDFIQPNGELGYFQHQWAVYGREGEKCRDCNCTDSIEQFVQNGRSTYWCRKKQK